jgi:uncharacterized protein YwqG
MSQMQAHPWQDQPTHRLLGWPQLVQSEMRDGLYPRGHRDWRLLLQLDTHHRQRLVWQGGGRGYFWIREADLPARNFDRTWLVMQCT